MCSNCIFGFVEFGFLKMYSGKTSFLKTIYLLSRLDLVFMNMNRSKVQQCTKGHLANTHTQSTFNKHQSVAVGRTFQFFYHHQSKRLKCLGPY